MKQNTIHPNLKGTILQTMQETVKHHLRFIMKRRDAKRLQKHY